MTTLEDERLGVMTAYMLAVLEILGTYLFVLALLYCVSALSLIESTDSMILECVERVSSASV